MRAGARRRPEDHRLARRGRAQEDGVPAWRRAPATVELFFSWEAVSHHEKVASGRAKNEGYSRLEFKIPVANSANVISEKVLNYSHSELNEAAMASPWERSCSSTAACIRAREGLGKLKHLYLEHNRIGDGGAASVAKALNRSTTPNLRRIVMRNNRIGVQGCIGMAAAWGCAAVERRLAMAMMVVVVVVMVLLMRPSPMARRRRSPRATRSRGR